jgi:hypothetical protein
MGLRLIMEGVASARGGDGLQGLRRSCSALVSWVRVDRDKLLEVFVEVCMLDLRVMNADVEA